MDYLFKIKCESTLRRVSVQRRITGGPDLSFSQLQAKVRSMFQISADDKLIITYTDEDNEVVTMADDEDLHDACSRQNINPLRLEVKIANVKTIAVKDHEGTSSRERSKTRGGRSADQDSSPELIIDGMKQLLSDSEPYTKAAAPQELLFEVLDGLSKVVRGATHASFSTPVSVSRRQTETNSTYSQSGTSPLENVARIFHKGVQCDGCGMTPIVGPRFKSTRKEDYDLCFSCFIEIGNETDYQRLERPVHPRRSHYYHPPSAARMMRHHMGQPTPSLKPFFSRGLSGWKHDHLGRSSSCMNANIAGEQYSGKLDARFVQDVTIFDGTEVALGTCFTKTWRLRNIGSLPWPPLTQLVHVGGDTLGSDKPSSLELPEQGLPCDKEVDASIDLVAPERPGRYVSHWKLMAPSGQKFGQRVWVLIQVVSKDGQSFQAQDCLQPDRQTHERKEHRDLDQSGSVMAIILVNDKSTEVKGSLPITGGRSSDKLCTVKEPVPNLSPAVQQGLQMVEDSSDLGFSLIEKPAEIGRNFVSDKVTHGQPSSSQKYVVIENTQDSSAIKDGSNSEQHSTDLPGSENSAGSCIGQEEHLLEMLNSMGFNQRNLNLELLCKNKNDMQGTIDDLVATSGWDHMLDDLEGMGFYDAEINRRLLFKNNGIVKLVVKELLEMQNSRGNNKNQALAV